MEIVASKKVEKIIYDEKSIIKKLGLNSAQVFKRRLNQLMASGNFYTYLETGLGNPHKLVGNFNKCYALV